MTDFDFLLFSSYFSLCFHITVHFKSRALDVWSNEFVPTKHRGGLYNVLKLSMRIHMYKNDFLKQRQWRVWNKTNAKWVKLDYGESKSQRSTVLKMQMDDSTSIFWRNQKWGGGRAGRERRGQRGGCWLRGGKIP